jgi:2-polyprenyl-3-methyl-5-hydroxy-6-metoxy-1,4-benzoquinol methylase
MAGGSARKRLKRIAALLPSSQQRLLHRLVANRRDREIIGALEKLNKVSEWEHPPCALCGEANARPHTLKNGFTIVECINDGLLFVSPRPRDVSPYYDSRYYLGGVPGVYQSYEAHVATMESEWSARLRLLEEKSSGTRRLLDVGAATGAFVALAASRGWAARGIELSGWAASEARRIHGVDVLEGSLPDARFVEGEFDVVTMWDCIEHLSDPRGVLDAIRLLLAPGGVVALSTGAVPHRDPRSTSGWYYPPWHLYYFSRETMTALLNRCGFEIVDFMIADEGAPYSIMTVIARRS